MTAQPLHATPSTPSLGGGTPGGRLPPILACTRFNNKTWQEYQQWMTTYQQSYEHIYQRPLKCIYGAPREISHKKIPPQAKILVIEMNNDENKIIGIGEIIKEFTTQLGLVEAALLNYPNTDISMFRKVKSLRLGIDSCKLIMYGDELLTKHELESAPSMTGRLGMVEYMLYDNTAGVTNTHRANLETVKGEYSVVSAQIKRLLSVFYLLEENLAQVPIPYTKSRGLAWKED